LAMSAWSGTKFETLAAVGGGNRRGWRWSAWARAGVAAFVVLGGGEGGGNDRVG